MMPIIFKKAWNSIIFEGLNSKMINIDDQYQLNRNDQTEYFKEKPILQNFLVDDHQIIQNNIEYSKYYQLPAYQMDISNIYDCFHGILAYIFYYSDNKFNTEELEFYFSGGKNINCSTVKKKQKTLNILNIFDYANIDCYFTISSVKNAFFGVTFKKIKINPIAYAIRTGIFSNSSSNLISFTFEGFDEENDKWDILDERVNSNELVKSGSFAFFYVRSTKKCYSSFKITQTEPGTNGFWGFTISGFDVHGIISLRKNRFVLQNDIFEENKSDSNKSINIDDYNPFIDMSTFLF